MATLDTAFEAIITVALLALLIERALALVFESGWWLSKMSNRGITTPLKIAVSYGVCRAWNVDVFSQSILVNGAAQKPSASGIALTALIVAGGTLGVKKLFHDFLDIKSAALRAKQG